MGHNLHMLNTIRQAITGLGLSEEDRRKAILERYPDNPMAGRVQWVPTGSGGSNIRTHKLVRISPLKMVFRPTIQVRLFTGIFVLVGLVIMAIPVLADDAPWWIALVGLLFAAIGGLMYHQMTRPSVFDMEKLWFWKGKMPQTAQEVEERENTAPLDRVLAVQVLRQYCMSSSARTRNANRHATGRSLNQGYYSYELNLVLDDATRINVTNHGNHRALVRDARQLAEFLDVPLWDASDL